MPSSLSRRAPLRAVIAAVVTAALLATAAPQAFASTEFVGATTEDPAAGQGRSQGAPVGPLARELDAGGAAPAPTQDLPEETGSLSGYVYLDGGPRVPGVEVTAFRSTGAPGSPFDLIETVVTDESGAYAFDALPVGGYDLLFSPTDPEWAWGWVQNLPAPAAVIDVVEGENFAPGRPLYRAFPMSGSVTGGLGSTPLEGATVTLWGSRGPEDDGGMWFYPVDEVSTAAGGAYSFAHLPHGYYIIEYGSPSAAYKGEWWKNKANFESANVVDTNGRASYVANTNLQQRVNLGTVAVSGASATGSKLTATHRSASGTVYRYTWLADGVAISGATAKTFVPTAAQQHKQISVRVKGMKTGMISSTVTSEPRAKVLLTAIPKITGKTAILGTAGAQWGWDGSTLTASPGTWTTGAQLDYRWYADGKAIPDATGKTYTLQPADRYKRITVKVTGSKWGYGTFTRTSSATPRIATLGFVTLTSNPSASSLFGARVMTSNGFHPGATFTYYFYANGVLVQASSSPVLGGLNRFVGQTLRAKVVVGGPGYADHTLYTETSDPVTR